MAIKSSCIYSKISIYLSNESKLLKTIVFEIELALLCTSVIEKISFVNENTTPRLHLTEL